tara:strand:- start:1162 stop:1332 length:171 start_codon:yes stop_codon:yes gene_type:complete
MLSIFKHPSSNIKQVLLLLLFLTLLTACGNKGPLIIPEQPQDDINIEQSSDNITEQ